MDAIYFDFARAIHRVPKRRFLAELRHYGIQGDILSWIEVYLVDRRFRLRVGDNLSKQFSVSSGVPQGCTLGPLMFLRGDDGSAADYQIKVRLTRGRRQSIRESSQSVEPSRYLEML